MLHLTLLKFSPRMVSLNVLRVLLQPLCLICWLFSLSASTLPGNISKVQNLAFCILLQYSSLWSTYYTQYWTITLHRCLKSQGLGLASQIIIPTPVTGWSSEAMTPDTWNIHLKNWAHCFADQQTFLMSHTQLSLLYTWIIKQPRNTLATSTSITPTHHGYCHINNYDSYHFQHIAWTQGPMGHSFSLLHQTNN